MSLEDIVQAVSTEKITDIDIWSKLKHYFTEYWDGQPDIFQQVLNLSNRQLGVQARDINNTSFYFEALENNFSDKNDLLEFLINLTGYLNYHTELGSVNVKESLQQCRQNLRKVRQICIKRGIFKDQHFVGRENEMKEIQELIQSGDKKGILLCGLGGMGKTCLANTVCYELRRENWPTTRIELREQRTFRHFLRTTIHSISELRGSTSGSVKVTENGEEVENLDAVFMEESALRDILTNYIKDKKSRKQIFLFDNLEDSTTDPMEKLKVLGYLKSLLEVMKNINDCKIRIVITSQEDFLINTSDESTSQLRQQLKYLVHKTEVKKLDLLNATKLVEKCTRRCGITDDQINCVVRICGACPLALRVVSDLINNSIHAAEVISVLGETVGALPTSVLNMQQCLSKPYENLKEYKPVLCQLSLFGSTKFNLRSAARVVYGNEGTSSENLRDIQLKLLLFKSRHLLEIQNDYEDDVGQYDSGTEFEEYLADQKIFSFHPVVCKFLTEREKDIEVADAVKRSKYNFLSLLDEIVVGLGEEYDSNVLLAREKSEKMKVHILKYLQIMEGYDNLMKIPFIQNLQSIEEVKRRSNVVQMIHNPGQHLSYLQSMTLKFKGVSLARCSWEVEHISAIIRYEQIPSDIVEKCKDVTNTLDKFPKDLLNDNEAHQLLILKGRMLYNRGLLEMDCNQELSTNYFLEAMQKFSSRDINRRSDVKLYLADIYNCLGCIYYRKNQAEDAIKMHEKALQTLGRNLTQNESILTFYANIGACHFRLGIQHLRIKEEGKCQKEMEKALKHYRDSISVAQALKMQKTDIYLKKLKNRGDVYTMLKKFTEAEKDYSECIEIVRTLYPSPSRKEIICLHAKGDLIRRKIRSHIRSEDSGCFGKSNDEKVNDPVIIDLLQEGIKLYNDVFKIMTQDVLPGDHEYFEKIKTNHVYFLKQGHETEMLENVERKYSAYHTNLSDGDDSSRSQSETSSDSGDDVEEPHRCLDNQSIHTQMDTLSQESSTESDSSQINDNTQINNNLNDISQQKQNFKLPLQAPMKSKQTMNTVSHGFPNKRTKRSSSSGVSSTGGLTPDLENMNIRDTRASLDSGQGSSFEDEVFPNRQSTFNDRRDLVKNPDWQKRRSKLGSFGSGSLEDSSDMEMKPENGQNKRKLAQTKESASAGETPLKKQKSDDWVMKDKLSPFFEGKKIHKSSQTDNWSLANTVKDLEGFLPAATPRLRTLVMTLESGNAQLIDDENGRPIIEYTGDMLHHIIKEK